MKKKSLALLLVALLITGCNSKEEKNNDKKSNVESNIVESNSNGQENKKGYTNEELVKLAGDYYEKINSKKAPIVEVDHTEGDNVIIHLYEMVDNHTATFDWYTVDKNTGKGTDVLGKEIDLTK